MSKRHAVRKNITGACVYCGGTAEMYDHIYPAVRGGKSVALNLCACCCRCSHSKGMLTPAEWRGQVDVRAEAVRGLRAALPYLDEGAATARLRLALRDHVWSARGADGWDLHAFFYERGKYFHAISRWDEIISCAARTFPVTPEVVDYYRELWCSPRVMIAPTLWMVAQYHAAKHVQDGEMLWHQTAYSRIGERNATIVAYEMCLDLPDNRVMTAGKARFRHRPHKRPLRPCVFQGHPDGNFKIYRQHTLRFEIGDGTIWSLLRGVWSVEAAGASSSRPLEAVIRGKDRILASVPRVAAISAAGDILKFFDEQGRLLARLVPVGEDAGYC